MTIIGSFISADGKRSIGNGLENTLHVYIIFIDLSSIHYALTFIELPISMFPVNSAYKIQVTGSGNGLLNRTSMRRFS